MGGASLSAKVGTSHFIYQHNLMHNSWSPGPDTVTASLGGSEAVTPGELAAEEVAAISLPPSLFDEVTDGRENVGVFFAVYDISSLFPVTQDSANGSNMTDTVVGSSILASTVGPGIEFNNLTEPVAIILRLTTDARVSYLKE